MVGLLHADLPRGSDSPSFRQSSISVGATAPSSVTDGDRDTDSDSEGDTERYLSVLGGTSSSARLAVLVPPLAVRRHDWWSFWVRSLTVPPWMRHSFSVGMRP